MSILQPVQALGINASFVSDRELTLTVEAGYLGSGDVISLEDGTPHIKIERDLLSAKHKIHFIDAQSNSELFEMVKERFEFEYHAENPDGSGTNLFELNIQASKMGGPTVLINFSNAASDGSVTQLEWKVHTFDKVGKICWQGQPVAEIEKESHSKPCSIRIAPGVDPLPIIAMLMALTDRARKRKHGTSSMGGAGGFYTAGMGAAAWQGATLGAAGL